MRRRVFLTGLAGGLLLPITRRVLAAVPEVTDAPVGRYLSARADGDEHFFLSAFDSNGRLAYDLPLPGRGHGMAVSPRSRDAVLVARRPGTFLVVFDVTSGEVIHQLESRPDRHFFGHAVYSADGRLLYTSENDFEQGKGVIGIRDVGAGYRQIGEFSSYGIEPHDLRLCQGGRALVVANGGIITHPDFGRAKLNLDSMSSSLVYIETGSGRLLSEHRLSEELRLLSLRHLALATGDQVCVAMQYQGTPEDHPPLLGVHRPGEKEIRLLAAPAAVLAGMRNYCGSVCADSSGQWFAASSPQGGLITFWSAPAGDYLGNARVADGCGIAAGARPGEFLLSGGNGGLYRYEVNGAALTPLEDASLPDARWDNHMMNVNA